MHIRLWGRNKIWQIAYDPHRLPVKQPSFYIDKGHKIMKYSVLLLVLPIILT